MKDKNVSQSRPDVEAARAEEIEQSGAGKLPGWTLAVNLGVPLLAGAVAIACRSFGASWWVGGAVAAAVLIGGLLWERSIERKYLSASRRS